MAKYTITLDKLLDRTDRGNVLQAIGMIRGVEDIDGVPLPEESPTKSPNTAMDEIMVSKMANICAQIYELGMKCHDVPLPWLHLIRDSEQCAKYYKIPLLHQ